MFCKDITTSPKELKGVGSSFLLALKRLNVQTIGDLLQLFPRNWEDRSHFQYLAEYRESYRLRVKATIISHSWFGFGTKRTLKIGIEDDLSNKASLVCFNRPFLQTTYPIKSKVVVTGVFSRYRGGLVASSFEIEKEEEAFQGILPIYPLAEGLTQKKLKSTIQQALNIYLNKIDSDLPRYIELKHSLPSKKNILSFMHMPNTLEEVNTACKALVFEELFFFQYNALRRYTKRKKHLPEMEQQAQIHKAVQLKTTNKMLSTNTISRNSYELKLFSPLQQLLKNRLPFSLTEDQLAVILEINKDLDADIQSSRMIQGDVGSGKTLVAFFASLYAIQKKWQVALLAPTELLALQHAESASRLLTPLGISVAFLSGNTKTKGRTSLLKALKAGEIDLIIGTHAIFSDDVEYKNLHLAIIDEQHKFGVLQREALLKKGQHNKGETKEAIEMIEASQEERYPHLLMMSATPIPRSLALSIFGDIDVSTIKTMPHGRLPIKTYLANNEKSEKVYNFVKGELQKGRQAYFIYPLIEESENLKFKDVEKMKTHLIAYFRNFVVESITSKTDEAEQKKIMSQFIQGKIHVLVATSIVEVGVDVPNATCIVIEDAQKFPLATLHQMRGRVGRGKEQSYCILIYEKGLTDNAYKRLKIMRDTCDGFKIAEEDLKIRGPGDIMGIEQSGYLGFKFANPIKDYELLLEARKDAMEFIQQEEIIQSRE